MKTKKIGRKPIWDNIYQQLHQDILQGRFQVGEKLPTEANLSMRFGVNRHTIRRALLELKAQGFIYSRRGSGFFVDEFRTFYTVGKKTRFHANIESQDKIAAKKILYMNTRHADDNEQEMLKLSPIDKIHHIEGVAYIENRAVGFFSTSIPASPFPKLLTYVDPENYRLTNVLKKSGLNDYKRIATHLTAVPASAVVAQHLKLEQGDALLRTYAIDADMNGLPVSMGYTWWAGDKIEIVMN